MALLIGVWCYGSLQAAFYKGSFFPSPSEAVIKLSYTLVTLVPCFSGMFQLLYCILTPLLPTHRPTHPTRFLLHQATNRPSGFNSAVVDFQNMLPSLYMHVPWFLDSYLAALYTNIIPRGLHYIPVWLVIKVGVVMMIMMIMMMVVIIIIYTYNNYNNDYDDNNYMIVISSWKLLKEEILCLPLSL